MSRYEAPEIGAACERMLKALAKRAAGGEAEAVEQLAGLEHVVVEQLGRAVRAHRQAPAEASWQQLGDLLGTSRQAAHRRFAVDGEDASLRTEAEHCTCLLSCMDDPRSGCSLSGEWHVHPNRYPGDVCGPCPVHPDAPGDR